MKFGTWMFALSIESLQNATKANQNWPGKHFFQIFQGGHFQGSVLDLWGTLEKTHTGKKKPTILWNIRLSTGLEWLWNNKFSHWLAVELRVYTNCSFYWAVIHKEPDAKLKRSQVTLVIKYRRFKVLFFACWQASLPESKKLRKILPDAHTTEKKLHLLFSLSRTDQLQSYPVHPNFFFLRNIKSYFRKYWFLPYLGLYSIEFH